MRISGKSASTYPVVQTGIRSPKQKILSGALLGDVVEEITGSDLRIERYGFICKRRQNGKTICRHRTKAFAGRLLVGRAHVIWIGEAREYSKLVRQRMRVFLQNCKATPTITSVDNSKGLINRVFNLILAKGELTIEERIYFNKLERIKRNHDNL